MVVPQEETIGISELVDRLIWIANQRHLHASTDQKLQKLLVQDSNVLGLIDDDMGVTSSQSS